MSDENEDEDEDEEEAEEGSRTPRLTAEIGRIDGELHKVGFVKGEVIQKLLDRADITFSKGMEVTNDTGEDVSTDDEAEDGQVYWISGNYQNGKQ